jgi:hypothetical protein
MKSQGLMRVKFISLIKSGDFTTPVSSVKDEQWIQVSCRYLQVYPWEKPAKPVPTGTITHGYRCWQVRVWPNGPRTCRYPQYPHQIPAGYGYLQVLYPFPRVLADTGMTFRSQNTHGYEYGLSADTPVLIHEFSHRISSYPLYMKIPP